MSEEEVKVLLKSVRKLRAKKEVLSCFNQEHEEYGRICQILHVIDNSLQLLTDEEREIVQTHLIQGCTWEEVMKLYEEKHGQAQGYSERTYKRIQQKAIKQIVEVIGDITVEEL